MVDLNAHVSFQRRAEDANGDRLGPFAEVFRCRASVDYLRGTESAQQNRLQGKQPANIVVREAGATKEVDTGWRVVVLAGRYVRVGDAFDVQSAAPAQQRGFLTMLGVAGGATG